jgi:hypothetical protein
MQLFRQRSTRQLAGAAERIATWARSGRVAATQLELGAPIRWPGTVRDAFAEAVRRAFCAPLAREAQAVLAAEASRLDATRDDRRHGAGDGCSLQAYDPRAGRDGLGLAAAMGAMPDGRTGARLVLFPGGQRLVLVTGEEPGPPSGRVGGLEMEPSDGALHLRFRGPALLAPDASRHFRSEREQAKARVVAVEAELEWTAIGSGPFGALVGRVTIDGDLRRIATEGFTAMPPSRGAPEGGAWTRLAASFGRDLGLALALRTPSGGVEGERFAAAAREPVRAPDAVARPPRVRPPHPFEVDLGPERLACRPRTHLSWLRPIGPQRWARVTLGVAGYALSGGDLGSGLYEHVERVAPAPAPAGEATADGEEDE